MELSCPLSTNFSHQLKINMASDPDTRLHLILQLRTDIETGFNQWKPPHRTVCVAIDLTAAFDTVSHDILISKITGSSSPPAITRWLSCYLRGRQAATSFRGIKTRIVRTSSLFNYYIADMPRPTPHWPVLTNDHLHQVSLTLKVKDHSDMLSAQYLGGTV